MLMERTDEQIVSKANCTKPRLKLMIKALSIGYSNTPEENARLAAAKRLLAKMGVK
jgi:hypothetical protein